MNYNRIIPYDLANGNGVRVSLFVSGCNFHCKGCFNKEAQDFNYGKPYTSQTEQEILTLVAEPICDGLSILGGDAMCQDEDGLNQLIHLCKEVHKLNKNVWLWTGYTFDDVWCASDKKSELAINCDCIVDGQFDIKQKDLSLPWRGSRNQTITYTNQYLYNGEDFNNETSRI